MQPHDIVKRFKLLEDKVDLLQRELQWLRYERSHEQVVKTPMTKYVCEVCNQNTVRTLVCSYPNCPFKVTSVAL